MATDQEQSESPKPAASAEQHSENEQHASTPVKDDKPVDPAKKGKRAFLLAGVAVLVLIGIGIWWLISRNYEDTDDAQVKGHINPISGRVAGTIVGVSVENNQQVHAGEPLVNLDPSDYQVALTQAKAGYDQALAQSTAERPNLPITVLTNATDESTGQAEVAGAQAALAAAQYNYDSASAKLVNS
jgi:membrane fusion protein (multidrug efflux system)